MPTFFKALLKPFLNPLTLHLFFSITLPTTTPPANTHTTEHMLAPILLFTITTTHTSTSKPTNISPPTTTPPPSTIPPSCIPPPSASPSLTHVFTFASTPHPIPVPPYIKFQSNCIHVDQS
ncbi:hypothetical protein KP509_38G003500 [Ceratopteris richardii]|uniref:Uncharacterized protein n=1 Tax=Ceratopteris richardii TaxID=49495 RepID=A0A8T2Q225_CERRI|nr:hypothetical protein KP509_38G003500 [Ceratopteris richardii]